MEIITVRDPGPKLSSRRLERLARSRRPILKRSAENVEDLPRKRRRESSPEREVLQTANADSLPWQQVDRPHEAGFGEFNEEGGVLMLEEVDDVDVIYEQQPGGSRVVKFKVGSGKSKKAAGDIANPTKGGGISSSSKRTAKESAEVQGISGPLVETVAPPFDDSLLPQWAAFKLADPIKRSLQRLRFDIPTEIQRRALPFALEGRDVIGVAETGSGKTLAYGLPILQSLLTHRSTNAASPAKRTLSSLILAPTRELALQVCEHLRAIAKADVEPEEDGTEPSNPAQARGGPPVVSIAAVVGGMSVLKQKRVIARGMDIMIATPGRLWDLLSEDDELASQIRNVRFLVLDEADRMIETGHFEELTNILRLTRRAAESGDEDKAAAVAFQNAGMDEGKEGDANDAMQTFVFSATLSKELQINLKRRSRAPSTKKSRQKAASTLDDLIMRLDFRDDKPEVIDLSTDQGVSHTLQESKLDCLPTEKDLYLYYFLMRYPGRSLVFVNAIEGIRRLVPLLELLGFNVHPLHSQLQQKQRLKNLDRFTSSPNGVLVATDVAARGLDIPSVEHVIHYQIPRSADVYIHRSGRTARAEKPGFSLQICSPEERRVQRALMQKLGRSVELPELPVERAVLEKLKERVLLARKIDWAQHKVKKVNHDKNWLKETAEALEIELDSDGSDDTSAKPDKRAAAKVAAYKAELRELLAERVMLRGISAKYITSGSHPIAAELVSSSFHEKLVGVAKSTALEDVANLASKPIRNRA